jgi:predicted ester cyclase
MEADAVRVLVTRFYAVLWNAWDDSAVETVLADDFVFRGSLGTETTGRDAAPDFRNDLVDLVCEGDRAAARLVCSGHHRGLLLGLPGSGRPFRYDVTAFFRGRNGHLAEAWVLGDLHGLRRQLMQP